MNYYFDVLRRYADFSGRARRTEYWMFFLFHVIAVVVAAIIDAIVGSAGIFVVLYVLATFIPSLAVGARRLHDTGRSGWWQLISFIPLGGVILFIFYVLDSQPGPNEYGPNPKGDVGAQGLYAHSSRDSVPRDVTGELERLAALKERGALTEEEFAKRKQEILEYRP